MNGKKVSLCMIAKNEEKSIGRCLSSVRDAVDEIIVVDTGSSDGTRKIAESFGAQVYEFSWTGHFADARNYGIEQARGEWILWMDADEEVDAADAPKLRDVLTMDGSHPLVFVELVNFYGSSPPHPDNAYRIAHHRLFRNGCGLKFQNAIHEQLNVQEVLPGLSEMMILPVKIYHYGYLDDVTAAKEKHERNMAMLQQAAKEPDPDPWIPYHLASEYFRKDEYREAFQLVNHSIAEFLRKGRMPPSMLYKLKYASLLALGSYEGAWPGIDRAIAMYPDYVDLHFYKGMILLNRNKPNEALESFRHCLALGEDNLKHLTMKGLGTFHAWYYIGRCYEQVGLLTKAKDAYQEAMKLSPDHREAKHAYERLQTC